MNINSKTMLFENISDTEQKEMLTWAEDIILYGKIQWPDPPWVKMWLDVMGFNDNQRLLTISTVLPQRVLLSIIYSKN